MNNIPFNPNINQKQNTYFQNSSITHTDAVGEISDFLFWG